MIKLMFKADQNINNSENQKKIDSILLDFNISNEKLQEVSEILMQEFNKGLSKNMPSSVKMLPSFVRDIPDGRENGSVLALDLGGSKFRVLLIELDGEKFKMKSEIYELTESTMQGPGISLFDHIANCLAKFLEKQNMVHEVLPLGFTFSFPCIQQDLSSAVLIRWTKGFKCPGVEGKDVVQMLREAINRRGDIKIDIIAVVNDTTGTLMSCAHTNKNCRVGVIVGTGTNACYMEQLENVEKWSGDNNDPRQVIINCEWGAFGDNGCIEFLRTKFDREIDESSINEGEQLFEKMISGMYMGEIVRKIMVQLSSDGIFRKESLSAKFLTPYEFKSKYISFVELDKDGMIITKEVLRKMGIEAASEEECKILQRVCSSVSTRSANLVASGIATILNKMQREFTTVGIDGSVYRYHPFFRKKMQQKISELTNPAYKFELMLSEDGSGRGAALVAAVACKRRERLKE